MGAEESQKIKKRWGGRLSASVAPMFLPSSYKIGLPGTSTGSEVNMQRIKTSEKSPIPTFQPQPSGTVT